MARRVAMVCAALLGAQATQPDKTIVELAESVADLSTLVAALVGGDLVDTLSGQGPFTVFAPTNAAFAKLPAGTLDDLMKPENKAQLADILTYHVVSGQILAGDLENFQAVTTVEGKPLHVVSWGGQVQLGPSLTELSTVTSADNLAVNGVVHVIDGVLLPPNGVPTTTTIPTSAQTIAAIAIGNPDLRTLVRALTVTGLVPFFNNVTAKLTVFAPTNAAFAALGDTLVSCLLGHPQELTQLLEYHVVSGVVKAADIPATPVPTLFPAHDLSFKTGDGVKVIAAASSATVTTADVEAFNGVIHIVDGVLIPDRWVNPCAPEAITV